jgi:hypothetical protein
MKNSETAELHYSFRDILEDGNDEGGKYERVRHDALYIFFSFLVARSNLPHPDAQHRGWDG